MHHPNITREWGLCQNEQKLRHTLIGVAGGEEDFWNIIMEDEHAWECEVGEEGLSLEKEREEGFFP